MVELGDTASLLRLCVGGQPIENPLAQVEGPTTVPRESQKSLAARASQSNRAQFERGVQKTVVVRTARLDTNRDGSCGAHLDALATALCQSKGMIAPADELKIRQSGGKMGV